MNTVITRHYPASKLPEDLRDGIDPSSLVTVTITQRKSSLLETIADSDEITPPRQHVILTKESDVDLRGGLEERDE
jgi:hypothetical protein